MAFQFPDPAVATTVVNEATGITYQWQDPPGKWVIAAKDLHTYCVVQQTSTLETNADSEAEFYTDFEITGDKSLTTTVNEQVDYIVSYEGIEERVSNLSDAEKQKIGFIEIREGKYISQLTPDASLVGSVTLKQVITMFDIAGDKYECISPKRILFGPDKILAPQGTISQKLECCHKFTASPLIVKADRPPIVSDTEPTEHPQFPGEPLEEGDFWLDNTNPSKMLLHAWDLPSATWVPVGESGRPSIFSDTEPTVHPDFLPPDDELITGDIWYDTTDPDEIVQYIYDGNTWLKIGGDFVHRKGGDTMEGPLNITGDRDPNADGIVSTVKVMNVDSGQSSDLELRHNGNTKVYVGDTDVALAANIKVNQNNTKVKSNTDTELFTLNSDGVSYEGAYTDDKHIVTKEKLEEDQARQDQELADYKDKVQLDQDRQDKEIEEIKSGLRTEVCEMDVTGLFKIDSYIEGRKIITYNYATRTLYVDKVLGHTWPCPDLHDPETWPDVIYVNEVPYKCDRALGTSNDSPMYGIIDGIPNWRELDDTQVTVRICDYVDKYVTQEEFKEDQERQDKEIENLKGSSNISLMRVSQGNKAVWRGNGQDPPEADPDGKVGWYYRNPGVDSRKAHWTLWSQETNAHKHITLGDLKSLSLLIQGNGKLPFLQVYTKPQRDGQDATATYRSRISYQPPDNPGGLQNEVFVTTNPETDLYANVNRLEFEREEWNDKGPVGDDEEINKIVVSTNSVSPEGEYEFLLQAMAIETAIGTFEMQLEITGVTGDLPEQMVFYGTAPPDEAAEGALFTDEDTLKQFVHTADGTWAEVSHWTGDGEPNSQETPWIRIDDVRVLRQYSGSSLGSTTNVAKVLIYEFHYEDKYASTITKEWEWDENGDGNWVEWDPYADPNVTSDWLESNWYFYYLWPPEGENPIVETIDPNHPHPCAKVRLRLVNTWDDGTFEKSDWYEFWIGKQGNPTYGQPHQPPSVC